MINGYFTTAFNVYRMVWSGESSSEMISSSFYGHLQQANGATVKNLADSITVSHSVWCPLDTNIKVGDRLTSKSGFFTIKQIFKYDTGGNQHLELLVEKEQDYASI